MGKVRKLYDKHLEAYQAFLDEAYRVFAPGKYISWMGYRRNKRAITYGLILDQSETMQLRVREVDSGNVLTLGIAYLLSHDLEVMPDGWKPNL